MQKNELRKWQGTFIRILSEKGDQALIIDCIHRKMPVWMNISELDASTECSEEELFSAADIQLPDFETLSSTAKRISHERYALIAGILPFVANDALRTAAIKHISIEKSISRQTLRRYLCLYLALQNIAALAPVERTTTRPLTQDEKNMRWALNKYYYTKRKISLSAAYSLMLKEKYCDGQGTLLPLFPSIHQFRYFHKKYNKLQTQYISRDGIKDYQRNHRPLLGEGIREFAPAVGVGMLDSTICDIFLVNDAGELIGRPLFTACVDAYSGLCCGYALSWEGGVYSLRQLMNNILTDKVAWCKKFGITIDQSDWPCNQLPGTLVTDMGREYTSTTFEQIAELGVTVVNLPAYRPELKGTVERFFGLVQGYYKQRLKGKGVIEPDFQERGAHDYRKDACLTMEAFETILLHCILYYNSKRIIQQFPYTPEMMDTAIQPHASAIWNWGQAQAGAHLISVTQEQLHLTLLPRTQGKFCRNGLHVNKLRYRHDAYTERYLAGGSATVAYDPDNTSTVWLIEKGEFVPFTQIESRYAGKDLSSIHTAFHMQQQRKKVAHAESLQAQIALASHIETIASNHCSSTPPDIKNTRSSRLKEQNTARHKGGSYHA